MKQKDEDNEVKEWVGGSKMCLIIQTALHEIKPCADTELSLRIRTTFAAQI